MVVFCLFSSSSSCNPTDINECWLGASNCRLGERCINTEGSFRCQREVSCGTGYELTDANNCKGPSCTRGYFILFYFFARVVVCTKHLSLQTLTSARSTSITAAEALNAKTPRGHFVVSPRSNAVLVLFRMHWETALVSVTFN